ncbi:MAG: Ni/Fe-hydrogenase cytochrome b subunit [FCB group bacterium]|nr:Ni/Fe-hydrogenase cytochrome b subunit [FCB group bacterium]
MNRVRNTKTVLWMLTGLAAAVGITRFIFGLGATTNLTDTTPWGIWIGFDVMAGVALAGGGFVMTAIFYMFKREKYHPLVKPAVLTAFLGYIAVVCGLMFDLGLPWNIWHMIVFWNPHSPLFEVGWCVMLYTTVLLLEFSPVPLEEFSRYAKIRSFIMRLRFPLVLLGIMLSTLHQSSLGSLFLIMPYKMHPLWYSPIMPVMFFISAVALGLMMVSLESLASHWLYRRKPENDLVSGLMKAAVWVLAVYFLIKIADIAASGEMGLIFAGTWEGNLFILEMLISVIIPIIIFSVPRLRGSSGGQWTGSFLVVFGMIFNRINVGGLTMVSSTGSTYIPSWMEIAISLGVVSAAGLVFLFAIEKLHIWESRPSHPEADAHARPEFDYSSRVWLGVPGTAARTRYSLAFVLSFALGFAFIPDDKIASQGVDPTPAHKARGGDVLYIDGNHDGYGTGFNHAAHIDSLGGTTSCVGCHHMNLPGDKESGCWECHRSMYSVNDVFNHDWHADENGGNLACLDCHAPEQERQKESAKTCNDCHLDLYPEGTKIAVESYLAPSYVDVMHRNCIVCHRQKAAENENRAKLALCPTCHAGLPPDILKDGVRIEDYELGINNVILPDPGELNERQSSDN